MTNAERDALEAAAKAATPGPWKQYACYDIVDNKGLIIAQGMPKGRCEDFTYIAAANPEAVLSMIAELRQAERRRLRWKLWREEEPKASGWYFVKSRKTSMEVVNFDVRADGKVYRFAARAPYMPIDWYVKWAGPIPEPEEA